MHRKLRGASYDLIHAQFGQSGILALPARAPLVITFQGSDVHGIVGKNGRYTVAGRVLQHVSRLVARRADQAIVVSRRMIDFLPQRSYHVLPSGIDMELFSLMSQPQARQVLHLDQSHRPILFGANPAVARKRIGLAQAAVEIASSKFPDARLLTLGGISHDRVPYYMNASEALLLTSLHEGSPNVVKEALACNLPVVSTDVGDVRERVGAVEGCVVCADDRPETIAEGLTQVLGKRQRVRGRESIQELDERVVTRKVIEVYNLALSHG